MATYIIVSLTPRDAEKLAEYAARAAETLTPFGGEVIARGAVQPLHGLTGFKAKGVMQFPTEAQARDWYRSDAYQALIPLRDEAMDAEFHLISAA